MKKYKLATCTLGFLLAFTVAATAADAPRLTFKFTTINVPGALQTYPSGINNAGVVVGTYQDKNMRFHGYIMDGKKLTTLDDPNGSNTNCLGVNLNGAIMVVGAYDPPVGSSVGFLYKNGQFTDIPGPNIATGSVATGINDSGNIVGYYTDLRESPHGFLLKGTTYTTLDVPGAIFTLAEGINNNGKITLIWEDSKGMLQSSLYNGKTYKTINVPGASQSGAIGINAAGDVAYGWWVNKLTTRGALLHADKFYKFNYPKAMQTYGGGINDKNFVVGQYQIKNKGPWQGFKATYRQTGLAHN